MESQPPARTSRGREKWCRFHPGVVFLCAKQNIKLEHIFDQIVQGFLKPGIIG
jgi:hypothetical protein